ncbi:FYN-binding protein 1 isoform X1 [Micropterus dolomieu]|uniref:FYN-binding protein 1 isoform X1 n=1 Tax=Micropterus dolomieu TaxID=147949 RepID=UPI001E8D56B5|nr:FYN-binding protein 1 isoform X1 [Micropterus dolomieu]
MGESIDVKALRARFNNQASTSDTSSRDSSSPKSPRPGFGRAILPVTENDLAHHRLSPTVLPPLVAGQGLVRFPRAEPMATSIPSRPFPRPPPSAAVRASIQPTEAKTVKQTGEMLQNMMLRHQRPPGTKPALMPALASAPTPAPAPAPTSTPLPLRQQPRQRSTGEVTPLRKPLPPEGPLPLKPKRPPNVNLEPFLRFRGPALPGPRKLDAGSPSSAGRKMSLTAVISPPKPPQRSNKPNRLPRQVASVDIDDNEDYDDIANFEKNESCSDNSSQCLDGDDDDVYESIDEDQVEVNRVNAEKENKKEAKRKQEQEKKGQMERQKIANELRKNFQLEGEVEVLHTARVRHDWHGGGKLDLSVQQDDSVEILRVKNNPGGKWLARSLNGNYGYISNTCVDIDYEAVKRKLLQSRKMDTSPLPPLPPDLPKMIHVESNNRDSMLEDDDDYDDVQPISEDFPPPPPEISIDPKVVKELRKRFKYDGPLRVLHTMMVDPNCTIKKPGGKDLHVSQGEVLDVIQLTNNKKALCRNQFGKYGYVSRSLLLPMEGDIYDDVDYAGDIYDNDSPHNDY